MHPPTYSSHQLVFAEQQLRSPITTGCAEFRHYLFVDVSAHGHTLFPTTLGPPRTLCITLPSLTHMVLTDALKLTLPPDPAGDEYFL